MRNDVAERPAEAVNSFAALSAAVHPAWHQAILRLASATEGLQEQVTRWMGMNDDGLDFVRASRELAAWLIDFLDEIDGDPDLEPSLGSGLNGGDDRELDDCELEDDDPAEDDGTREPSLAAIERHPSCYMGDGRNSTGDQTAWAAGGVDDGEDEHDGSETEFWPEPAA